MSITEEMCVQAVQQLVNGLRLPESPGHHFTHSRIYDGKSTLYRLNYWNTLHNKLLWIAYTYDNRKVNSADIPELCKNMVFGPSDLRFLVVGSVVVYDPDRNIEPHMSTQIQRAGMNSPFQQQPNGQIGYQGGFGNQPWNNNQINHPGFSQFQFGDFPPGPRIGDMPNMPDYTFGQPVRTAAHIAGFRSHHKTASSVLMELLSLEDQEHLKTIRDHLNHHVNGSIDNWGECEVEDGDVIYPKVRVGFDVTRTPGPSEKGYLIIRRLLTDWFLEDGFRLEFTKNAKGFNIDVNIDV